MNLIRYFKKVDTIAVVGLLAISVLSLLAMPACTSSPTPTATTPPLTTTQPPPATTQNPPVTTQTPTTPAVTPSVNAQGQVTVAGTISNFQADALTIKTAQGELGIEIGNTTLVKKSDGSNALRSDLKTGANVAVTYVAATKIAVSINLQ